jgi:hydroxypyruvate reductase
LERSETAALTDSLSRLRTDLHHILRAAVDDIEPGHLVRSAFPSGAVHDLPPSPLFLVAAGKAACAMALAFPGAVEAGVVAGPRGRSGVPVDFDYFDAAHPSPEASSEAAARRAIELAIKSRSGGSLIVLLSGGASSMLAAPAPGLSLGDKTATARALMDAGTPIADLNCVRKHLSAIKGGRLAALASQTLTLAISDVHGPAPDDPAVIGSGPTVADPTTHADALQVVQRADVAQRVPRAVIAHLQRGADETPKPGDPRLSRSSYVVIGNRNAAMNGAAREAGRRGYVVHTIEEATSGEAREAGAAFASRGMDKAAHASGARVCVIASGETTVRIVGSGRGGRNQEFALAAVPLLDSRAHSGAAVVVASAGTDGIDGPTDAAGAIVDTSSGTRARRAGLRWDAALACNGAYDFFAPLGDLIVWGPTGTNVGDLHVMLIGG